MMDETEAFDLQKAYFTTSRTMSAMRHIWLRGVARYLRGCWYETRKNMTLISPTRLASFCAERKGQVEKKSK